MNNITTTNPQALAQLNDIMDQAGRAADKAAAAVAFDSHREGKAENTIRRKRADLALFETFLQSVGVPAAGMYDHPEAWRNVTWGLVEAFRKWQLQQGYAIGSINGRLSTVRTFARIAAQAGTIAPDALRMIETVGGYSSKEARNIDDRRRADGVDTRKAERANIGKPRKDGAQRLPMQASKKTKAVTIPEDIAEALTRLCDPQAKPEDNKNRQADTPQGRRDALIMCLLIDHGLRVEEAAILTRAAFDMKAGTFTFYRPKVDKIQTHTMTPDTRNAARAYLKHAPADGIIWRKSSKGTGKLGGQVSGKPGTAERMIARRVELLGRHAGIEGLSPHDCRHYAATFEARKGTPVERLVDMFGWNSPAMAFRYIEAAAIANEGTARVKQR